MLTEKELLLLKYLREDARIAVTELSRKINLPRSTVNDKIKKLQNLGVIKRYACTLNFHQLDLPIQAKVLFKVGTDKNKLAEELTNSPYTNNVTKLGNEFDFLVSFAFQNMESLHFYIDELAAKHELKDYKIYYISKELKREGFSAV